MEINVRMEGGLGDHILANRFVLAIKEKYPQSEIRMWSDTEGSRFQSQLIQDLWPEIGRAHV